MQRVVTDLGVFDPAPDEGGFRVVELAPGVSQADLGDVPIVA